MGKYVDDESLVYTMTRKRRLLEPCGRWRRGTCIAPRLEMTMDWRLRIDAWVL